MDGPRIAREVKAGAAAVAISLRTVRLGKDLLDMISQKSCLKGVGEWILPQASDDQGAGKNPERLASGTPRVWKPSAIAN